MKKIGIAVLALVLPVILLGQIEIDWTEIPDDIGTIWWENSADSVTVDIGSTGGPHTWDFTSQPMGTDSSMNRIVDKGTTPYADSFPTANLTTMHLLIGDATVDTSFHYERLAEDSINFLGMALKDPTLGKLCLVFNPTSHTPLPVTYEMNNIDEFGFVMGYMGYEIHQDHRVHSKIDAYGTVTIPYKSFDCLRVCSYDSIHQWATGLFDTTFTYIRYSFVAENRGYVASISSYEGETNPNFTKGNLTRLTDYVGIEEKLEIRDERLEIRVHPNPATAGVRVQWSGVSKEQKISLSIYDLSGRLVRTLTPNPLSLTTAVSWDGRDEQGKKLSAGIYFCQLQTGKENRTKKIILMR